MLSSGKTGAIFQMESAGMTNFVKELQPKNFEDLIPTVALYRPGPLGSGMAEDFILRKHGRREIKYLHPKLEPILKETYGVILYQEQVMQIVQVMAGFTLGQADILRRAMSKKKAEVLTAQRENFLKGCDENGIEKNLSEKIFELLMHFADYGFNKSHSAAYALLAWQTAYLKANYPVEYMAAMMSSVMDSDKVAEYIELARRMKIKVLGPDINISGTKFLVSGNAIRFGLAAIKNIGQTMIDNLVAIRNKGGKFKSLYDFCLRTDLKTFNKKTIENLVKSGAFDSIEKRRNAQIEAIESIVNAVQRHQSDKMNGTMSLFNEEETINEQIKLPEVEEETQREKLAWEMETMGFYVSGHPLDEYFEKIKDLTKIGEIKNGKIKEGKEIKIAGTIQNLKEHTTRRGDLMCFMAVENYSEKIGVTIFSQIYSESKKILQTNNAVVIQGRVEKPNEEYEYEPKYYLTITEELNRDEIDEKLKTILENHKGTQEVFINKNSKWEKLEEKYKVSYCAELTEQLKNLLGEENVKKY